MIVFLERKLYNARKERENGSNKTLSFYFQKAQFK